MKRSKDSERTKKHRHRAKMRRAGRAACLVYGIQGIDGRFYYVGQTRLRIVDRMKWHMKAASVSGSPVQRWLYANSGEAILLDGNGIWDVSEVVWIERLRNRGEPLLNCNMGGRDTTRS